MSGRRAGCPGLHETPDVRALEQTLAALRARVATDLVIDDAAARAVLALATRKERA